jgi:hypothetical protein
MINNTNEILAQNINKVEGILMEFMHKIVKQEEEKNLNIDSIELLIGSTIAEFTNIVLPMAGLALSNISDNKETHCKCGKKLRFSKKDESISFLSMFGKITVVRDKCFCRRCGSGHGENDTIIGLDRIHRQTKGITEAIAYSSQLVPSFERASEVIKKFLHVEISATQMQIVSEEVGKEVFEKQMKAADEAYKKPEEVIPSVLEKDKKEGILYIMMDGSSVNTRIQDENNSSWKEMKLGLIFSDRNLITRSNGDKIITKKEYVTYFGEVGEFKKLVFDAAARAGYGILKKVVVIGDGAQWIWNMCEELFPDAVRILDYFHLSENIHGYAKALYPEDEIGRKIWVNAVLDLIKEDKVDEALEYISIKLIKDPPAGICNIYHYIENNKDRVKYKTYKAEGYYIGSGPIESGNKVVIQQRMKQSGMRWGVSGGQYIAALRAKYESNLWNDVVQIVNG